MEVKDSQTGQTYVFPCQKWLSKSKEDGEISRDLFPLTNERSVSRNSTSRSPRTSSRDFDRGESGHDFDRQRGGRDEDFGRKMAEFDQPRGGSNRHGFNEFDERPIRASASRDLERGFERRSNDFELNGRGSARDLERPSRAGADRMMEKEPMDRQMSRDFMKMPRRTTSPRNRRDW